MKAITFAACTCIFLFGCSTVHKQVEANDAVVHQAGKANNNRAQSADTSSLMTQAIGLTGTWELKSMQGSGNEWRQVPTLTLDVANGTFSGNTGCNSMNGRFVSQGTSVVFDNEIITTKMGCTGKYDEKIFLKNLLMVDNYKINDSLLQFRKLDTVKMSFKRQPI
jgi:heat shock protein HslJ